MKDFLPPLINSVPGGGYRTFIISLMLVAVGIGMGFAALNDALPADLATPMAITTILLGLQGFFGRAAVAAMEKQLETALFFIIDTRWQAEKVAIKEPDLPNTKSPDSDKPGNGN